MIKLIMSDMDGTLLDANGCLPKEFPAVIDELKRRGIIFVPASGRQYESLAAAFSDYQNDFIFIAEDGTMVKRYGKELFSFPLPREEVLRIVTQGVAATGACVIISGRKSAYVLKDYMLPQFMAKLKIFVPNLREVNSLEDVNDEFTKVAFFDVKADAGNNLYSKLYPIAGHLQFDLASEYWLDIVAAGVTKGAAVRKLQQMLQITPEECAAFGDYMNDADMLSSVYYGYAMANAHPDLKKAARFVAPSNTENGEMTVIKEMLSSGLCG